jgi:hypothetical protein
LGLFSVQYFRSGVLPHIPLSVITDWLSPTIANFLYKVSTPFSTPTAEILASPLDKVTSEVIFTVGLLSLESFLGRPISRKSVLEGLSIRRLADIQEQTLAIVFLRIAMFSRNSEEVKGIKS